MFYKQTPGASFMNRKEYRDKVLGCWTGKNIGEGRLDLVKPQTRTFQLLFLLIEELCFHCFVVCSNFS